MSDGVFNNEIIIAPHALSKTYCCIICNQSFIVHAKDNHAGVQPNQNMFCEYCLNILKDCKNREERNNYGY